MTEAGDAVWASGDPFSLGYPGNTSKAERTRAAILESALALFKDRGYEGTTMRATAQECGLSLGAAYYYFPSKEHLIQAFYARTHGEHLEACAAVLDSRRTLEDRLRGVMQAKLDTIRPYHQFAGALFKTAADPSSPLNPFSQASRPVREESTALFRRVVEGSDRPPRGDLVDELPNLLWIYHMSVILFWIHDRSNELSRTQYLVEKTVRLIAQLVRVAHLPPLRGVLRPTLELVVQLTAVQNGDRHETR